MIELHFKYISSNFEVKSFINFTSPFFLTSLLFYLLFKVNIQNYTIMKENLFSHINESGSAKMVDISEKKITKRIARAGGFVSLNTSTINEIRSNSLPKGNIIETARIAGIMGAKKTSELIPLCHPVGLENIFLNFEINDKGIIIESEVIATAKTGAEMEAITAVSVAAMTIYDMCKSAQKDIVISDIYLKEKLGGRSGHFINSRKIDPLGFLEKMSKK